VQLLTDLKAKIEMDGKSESQIYNKFACWCEKTTARKATSIEEAQGKLRELSQSMLKFKGEVATLISEIEETVQAIKANEEKQAQLTAIRQKENALYMTETAEMKEVLVALERAIIILRDGKKESSFLQQGTTASSAVKAVIEALPVVAALKPKQAALLSEFAAANEGSKYAPQSVTVQGILRDMYDTFSADLESATETEATRNRDYEALIATMTRELQALKEKKGKKESDKAEAEALLASDTQMYDDTNAQMKADIEFFDESKAACVSKHSEWGTRSELREEELRGITEALTLLSSDSARELFASAIKPGKETGAQDSYDTGVSSLVSLVQVSEEGPSRAYESLRASARSTHSLRLAALAVQVREAKAGHFDAVIKAIDTMISELKSEDVDDIAKRDQCKSEYQKINSTIAEVSWLIEKNEAAIDKLLRLIEKLQGDKAQTIELITEVETQISTMTSQRQEENQAFKNAKETDQAAIRLLAKAREALSSYYSNHSIELGPIQGGVKDLALAQQGPDFDISADQAPEAEFSGKGKRKHESKGIIQLLTMIMEDLNDEIKNDMRTEEAAQLEFEKQLAAAKKLKASLEEKKVNLQDMIAQRQQEEGEEQADMAKNKQDLENEQEYKATIKPDCDWIIGAFQGRAAKRAAEMQGLIGAKEYLVGYSQTQAALLERRHGTFDADKALMSISFQGIQH